MKSAIAILLVLSASISITSCGNKNDNTPSPKNKLTGTWDGVIQYELEYTDGDLTDGDTTKIQSPDYFKLTFNKSGKYQTVSSLSGAIDHESGTYQANQDQLTLQQEGASSETYTFSIKNSNLTLTNIETNQVNGHTIKDVERILFRK